MGSLHTLVATCGNGHLGRLGHGLDCSSQSVLRLVGSLVGHTVRQVACGGAHTAVLTDDGTVFTFGMNDRGQLGHSEDDKFVPVPLEVGLPDEATAVAAGDHHTMCLTSQGEVWAWGSHREGQLGIGQTPETSHKLPRLVKALSGAGVTLLAAGAEHSLAMGPGPGQAWSWGAGSTGALGLGAARQVAWEPARIGGPLAGARLRHLAAGLYTSGAVDDAGRAWTWGHGIWHALGHGTPTNEPVPRQVAALRNVASLALGHQSSWALTRDGRAFCWGTDDAGSLAQGEGAWQKVPLAVPQEVKTLPACKALSAGWRHAMGVGTDGSLFAWGAVGGYDTDVWGTDGGGGQLGLGDGRDHWAPVKVQRLQVSRERFYDLRMPFIKPWKAVQVSCGRNHSAAVLQVHLDMRDVSPAA